MKTESISTQPKWMCNLCYPYPKWLEIGIIGAGSKALIYDSEEDKYHILGGQGHRDDIITSFKSKPFPNPDPKDEDESKEMCRKVIDWMDVVNESFGPEWKMHPEDALNLHAACVEEGMLNDKEHRLWDMWLFHFCGKLIEKYENEQ